MTSVRSVCALGRCLKPAWVISQAGKEGVNTSTKLLPTSSSLSSTVRLICLSFKISRVSRPSSAISTHLRMSPFFISSANRVENSDAAFQYASSAIPIYHAVFPQSVTSTAAVPSLLLCVRLFVESPGLDLFCAASFPFPPSPLGTASG